VCVIEGRLHRAPSAPAMSLARYDANVLLAAVTALSAAVAFVAALHLYARCLLQRRVALAEGQGSPHVVVLQRQLPPDGYVVEVVEGAGVGGQQAAGLDAKALCALPVFTWESSEQEKEEEEGSCRHVEGRRCRGAVAPPWPRRESWGGRESATGKEETERGREREEGMRYFYPARVLLGRHLCSCPV